MSLAVAFSAGPAAGCGAVSAATLEHPVSGCLIVAGLAAASSTDPGQDWVVMLEGGSGSVGTFVGHGALPSALGIQYAADDVVEIEATPNGVPTDLCLGYGTGTGINGVTKTVTLLPCGQFTTTITNGVAVISDPTAWILDQGNDSGGYVDLISGTAQAYSLPQVLAINTGGSQTGLVLQSLNEMAGVVAPSQMWSFSYGSQSTAAIRGGAKQHT
jgi:hypothetical protein